MHLDLCCLTVLRMDAKRFLLDLTRPVLRGFLRLADRPNARPPRVTVSKRTPPVIASSVSRFPNYRPRPQVVYRGDETLSPPSLCVCGCDFLCQA